jgi:hypothetical protein
VNRKSPDFLLAAATGAAEPDATIAAGDDCDTPERSNKRIGFDTVDKPIGH